MSLKDLDSKFIGKTCQASPNLGILAAVTNLSRFMFEPFYSDIQDFQVLYMFVYVVCFATVVNFQDMCRSLVIVSNLVLSSGNGFWGGIDVSSFLGPLGFMFWNHVTTKSSGHAPL